MSEENYLLNEILRDYIYVTDEARFYSRTSKKPIKDSFIMAQLERCVIPRGKAAQVFQDMKDLGVTKDAAFPRERHTKEVMKDSYKTISAGLPFRISSKKGSNLLYHIDSNSQVTLYGDLDQDKFLAGVIADKVAHDLILKEYERDSRIAERLTFKDYIGTVYNNFVVDRSKFLEHEPELISWDPAVPAYRVLNAAALKVGPHPNWDSFLARMDFPETFKAYVWSTFEPRNIGRQALWLRGEGSDGKSSAVNAISSFLGRDYIMSIGKGTYEKDFFFGNVHGKRLSIYMDCKNVSILRYEKIKSLLGRDTVQINNKFEREFSAQVYSKLFVLSNFHPKINYNDNSERTRLLLCEVSTYKDEFGDPDFEINLEREFPAFLVSCREAYERECPNHANLRIPRDMVLKIKAKCASKEFEIMETFLEESIDFEKGARVPKVLLHNALLHKLQSQNVRDKSSFIEEDFSRLMAMKGAHLEMIGATSYYINAKQKITLIDYKERV